MSGADPREIPPACLNAIRWEAAKLSRRLPWRAERDDLEQEGRLAVWLDGATTQSRARVVARNAMYNEARRLMRWDRLSPDGEADDPAEPGPDLDAVLDVRDGLDQLDDATRRLLWASLDESPANLAVALGISRSGAVQRIVSARKRLRAHCGEGYEHMSRKVAVRYSKWARFVRDAKREQ